MLRGTAPRLPLHLARLRRSAEALGLRPSAEVDADVSRQLAELWQAGGAPARSALRITFAGVGARGLAGNPAGAGTLALSLSRLSDVADLTPLSAVTVSAHRVDPQAAISGHKVVSWMPWVLARRAARAAGADVALVATVDGDVCEADHANLFVSVGGVVVTPSLDRGVLPGITRARALTALRAAGRATEERPLTHADLVGADEAWLTSSLDGVRSLSAIDRRSLSAPGVVTLWLASCLE